MGDLVRHHAECLLADQLRGDLAHRLVCDSVLIVILRSLRQILEDRVNQGIRVCLLHRGYRDHLFKVVRVLIGLDSL